MGASSKPFLVAHESCELLPLWNMQRKYNTVCMVKSSRTTSRRRKNFLERARRPRNAVERRVRTLRKLVRSKEPMGIDGLFRDTADYIVALQMRVKLMQDLVDMFSSAGSDK